MSLEERIQTLNISEKVYRLLGEIQDNGLEISGCVCIFSFNPVYGAPALAANMSHRLVHHLIRTSMAATTTRCKCSI